MGRDPGFVIPDELLERATATQLVEYIRCLEAIAGEQGGWEPLLRELFAPYLSDPLGRAIPFGDHHRAFWDWLWALQRGVRARPFVGIWPRGGAKSTSAEMGTVVIASRRARRYALYVCESQDQADDHVGNIAAMLESRAVEARFPELAVRALGKYGNSKGWRRNRLRTPNFTIDAIGLDSAARGAKIDEDRPDLMVLDDLDAEHDTDEAVAKKVRTLTSKLLPAGASDLAVLAIQNLVHPRSIFARLAKPAGHKAIDNTDVDGADFLADRVVSGPIPALHDLAVEQRDESDGTRRWVIVAGKPSWAGQDVARCQDMVTEFGVTAFLTECQHAVAAPAGGIFAEVGFLHCSPEAVPDLVDVQVWVDPAVTDTPESDCQAIQVDGVAAQGTLYRLWSWEGQTTPQNAVLLALAMASVHGASTLGIETDQGGMTWESVFREACRDLRAHHLGAERLPDGSEGWSTAYLAALARLEGRGVTIPAFAENKASRVSLGGKVARWNLMLADYERPARIVHVLGTHAVLEEALRRAGKRKPFDLADSAWWCWYSLRELRAAAPPLLLPQGASGGWSGTGASPRRPARR